MTSPSETLITIEGLRVSFGHRGGLIQAVRGVSFEIARGEVVALVGESGSGKSTTGLALMGLAGGGSAVIEGSIRLTRKDGRQVDIARLSERALRQIRGDDVAMIFQEPMSSLNPIYTIATQLCETIRIHRRVSVAEARRDALTALTALGIPDPEKCMASYPHLLSGGMRQRVMIAMALACHPALLIADEPTTALDVTIQAQIVDQLKRLQRQTGMAILFITHNLGLVAEIADRALVMYAGEIVEAGGIPELFRTPRMPYTRALLQSLPRLGRPRALEAIPGLVPSAAAVPSGCAFHPRCSEAVPGRCDVTPPALEASNGAHQVRCLRWRELNEIVD
jgi:oligopeptide/dipeptide ABC transporter ATP-binding protein